MFSIFTVFNEIQHEQSKQYMSTERWEQTESVFSELQVELKEELDCFTKYLTQVNAAKTLIQIYVILKESNAKIAPSGVSYCSVLTASSQTHPSIWSE